MTWAGTNNTCLGYLMNFEGHGIYEPSAGKVDVTKDEAEKHNQCLSAAEIKGLDENCQVGQHGTFYYTKDKGVHTFIGTVVSTEYSKVGRTITFTRNGKIFRGRLPNDSDYFGFKRVS